MHLHRLMALTGVVIGVVGLFFSGLSTDGEGVLAALSAANPAFPDGIPTIWGGLDGWAQVVLVILIIVTVALAVMPDRAKAYDNTAGGITAVIGVALLAYAVVKMLDASDSAETLEGAFAQAAGAGIPGVSAWSVAVGIGFFVLMAGTVLVTAAGVLSLVSNNNE